jgi:hypothetical protein
MDIIRFSGRTFAACVLGGLAVLPAAQAADLAEARYRQELAACDKGPPDQDLAACRLEARNAWAEAKRGRLNGESAAQYQQNALQRCQAHTGDDRADCEARMRGEGRVDSSVEGGGLLHEIERVVPAK